MFSLDEIEQKLSKTVNNLTGIPDGAYNFRLNGKSIGRASTKNIDVIPRPDRQGINVYIKPGTKNEVVHILVMIKEAGLKEVVKSDFYIGAGSEITVVAGCGIYNCGASDSRHDGLHNFYLEPGAKLRYIEKLYAFGPGAGKILNPSTAFYLKENAEVEAEIEQIKGIDSSTRRTLANLDTGAKIVIKEKTFTHARQRVNTLYDISLNGKNSSAELISRTVATDCSVQSYRSKITANKKSRGHSSCDTIIKDSARATAVPELIINDNSAELIHEAALGRLNRAQIIKLMTLGFTKSEAEAKIINGFLS